MTATMLSLPVEIQLYILDLGGPDTHLPCALTCRALYATTSSMLRHHKQCSTLHRIHSDILPFATVGLLRMVLKDAIAAWHVRDLELWYLRRTWDEWTIPMPIKIGPYPNLRQKSRYGKVLSTPADYSGAGRKGLLYRTEELIMIRELLLSDLRVDEEFADKCITRIIAGDTEPIRLVLFAILPRLRTVTFVNMKEQKMVQGWGQLRDQGFPLTCLSASLQSLNNSGVPKHLWPPGFKSIRSLTIGVATDLSSHGQPSRITLRAILMLLVMPSLKELCVVPRMVHDGATYPRDVTEDIVNISIEKLCLNDLGTFDRNDVAWVKFKLTLARARNLRSFHHGGGCMPSDDLLGLLTASHGNTLESLELRCLWSRVFVRGELRRLTTLKHVVLNLEWMEGTGFNRKAKHLEVDPRLVTATTLADILPLTTVTVSLSGGHMAQFMSLEWERTLDELIARTIREKTLPNLRAIFLGPLFNVCSTSSGEPLACNLTWDATFTASRHGDVEVLGNGTHPSLYIAQRVRELGVPRFVSAGDLASDPRREPAKFRARCQDAAAAALLGRIIRTAKELDD